MTLSPTIPKADDYEWTLERFQQRRRLLKQKIEPRVQGLCLDGRPLTMVEGAALCLGLHARCLQNEDDWRLDAALEQWKSRFVEWLDQVERERLAATNMKGDEHDN